MTLVAERPAFDGGSQTEKFNFLDPQADPGIFIVDPATLVGFAANSAMLAGEPTCDDAIRESNQEEEIQPAPPAVEQNDKPSFALSYRVEAYNPDTTEVRFYSIQAGDEFREYFDATGRRLVDWPYNGNYHITHFDGANRVLAYSKQDAVTGIYHHFDADSGELTKTVDEKRNIMTLLVTQPNGTRIGFESPYEGPSGWRQTRAAGSIALRA